MNRQERRQTGHVGEAAIKYDGRTLEFKVIVNTDEPIEKVFIRIKEAAQGPGLRMVLVAAGEMDKDEAKKVWEELFPIVAEQTKKGGST